MFAGLGFGHIGGHIALAAWAGPQPCQQIHALFIKYIYIALSVMPSFCFQGSLRALHYVPTRHASTADRDTKGIATRTTVSNLIKVKLL